MTPTTLADKPARRSPPLSAILWLAVLGTTLALGYVRFATAMDSPDRMDFESAFLPAAQAIRAGGSPYAVSGYVYPPPHALLIAALLGLAHPLEWITGLVIAAGAAAALVGAVAVTPRGRAPGWRLPFLAGAAVISLLWNYGVMFDLWALYPELPILLFLTLAAFLHTRDAPVASGFALGMTAAIKMWPALLILWLVRRPLGGRGPWIGVAAAGLLTVASALALGGPRVVAEMLSNALGMRSQPHLIAYSTSGASRLLFTRTSIAAPLVESQVLAWLSLLVLSAWVVGLLWITLRRPGDPVIALFHVVFCVILLLPVSHYVYLLLPLPALWWWLARLLRSPSSRSAWAGTSALAVWWFVALRTPPAGHALSTTWPSYLLIFGATLLAATASVLLAARAEGAAAERAAATVVLSPSSGTSGGRPSGRGRPA